MKCPGTTKDLAERARGLARAVENEGIGSLSEQLGPMTDSQRVVSTLGLQWASDWARFGCPVFSVTASAAVAMAMTDSTGRGAEDAPFPFPAICIQMPRPSPIRLQEAGEEIAWICVGEWRVSQSEDRPLQYIQGRTPCGLLLCQYGPRSLGEMAFESSGEETDAAAMLRIAQNLLAYVSSLRAADEPSGAMPRCFDLTTREGAPTRSWTIGRAIKLPGSVLAAARSGGVRSAAWKLGARFVVRGHWRHQACGEARANRKVIWIAPHWKGPDNQEAFARLYEIGAAP